MADEVRRFINGEIDEEGNQLTTVDANGNTVLISTGGSVLEVVEVLRQAGARGFGSLPVFLPMECERAWNAWPRLR